MMPDEDVMRVSGMTGQSLYYLGSDSVSHKTLAISEDAGGSEAVYALKLLQSEGELRHATVTRDQNGTMVTEEHHVEGPVQMMMTTTALEIDEELVNRCLVLSVDESRDQTDAILERQRQQRLAKPCSDDPTKLHQNAQRVLRPLSVFNPYADKLTFPNHKTRVRRDHKKYLTLIETIAFLHQYQRTVHDSPHGEFINVEPSDISIANRLAGEILGTSLDDLSPQTRRFLMLLERFDRSSDRRRFTRRDIREATGWSDFQVHKHLRRLTELEYVVAHRGSQGRRYEYELLYRGEGKDASPFLMGLADPSNF